MGVLDNNEHNNLHEIHNSADAVFFFFSFQNQDRAFNINMSECRSACSTAIGLSENNGLISRSRVRGGTRQDL